MILLSLLQSFPFGFDAFSKMLGKRARQVFLGF